MGKQRFEIELRGTAIIDLDDAVIEAVDDEWRGIFYNLHTPEQIAEHIAFNLIVRHAPLSRLDGWADQPRENAEVIEDDDWEVEAREVT